MYQGLFLWAIKLPGHAADYSPPYRTEVKNELNYTSTFPLIFTSWCMGITLPFLTDSSNNGDDDDDDNNNNNNNNNSHLCCGCLLSSSCSRGCFVFSNDMYEIVNKDICPVSSFTIFKT
jgi:hypothetical protein